MVFFVGLLSFLQFMNFFVFNVKPNWILIAIIVSVFFISDIWEGIFLFLLSALIFKFGPGFRPEALVLPLFGLGAIFFKKYLPWRHFLTVPLLLAVLTALFYAFLAPNLILSLIFLKELVYNLIIGEALFLSIAQFVKN